MNTHYDIFRTAALAFTAAVLAFGCAKVSEPEEQAPSQAPSGERYELTVEVAGAPATKTAIDGPNAENKLPVSWVEGDKLYVVGATDGYIGCLEMTGSAGAKTSFKGIMSGWTATQTLHIYYLGTDDPGLAAKATEFTFDISSQEGTLEWIAGHGHISHYATTEAVAPGNRTIGTDDEPASMENLNAVVLFDLSAWTAGTTISGTYNKAVLDLTEGEFTTTTEGNITIAAGNCTANTYVSFIPAKKSLTFKQGSYSTPVMENDVKKGEFYRNGTAAIDVPRLESDCLLSENFSISATVKVKFSKGNLQATCTKAGGETTAEYSWGFAENQWDYIGNAAGNTTINKQTDGAVVDLFGWVGASSVSTWDSAIHGISTQQYYTYYGGSATEALKADWADISTLPQVMGRKWKTLSSSEWEYLLRTRSVNGGTGEGNSYQRAYINSDGTKVYGMILYPDNYTNQTTDTEYTSSEWMTMENEGCVFLPVALYRKESSILDSYGCYWSSTHASTLTNAIWMRFSKNDVTPAASSERYYGMSVRLVSVEIPEGALSGRFSVASDKRVRFSKGNLQATCTKAGTETTCEYSWGFAGHQWDYIGNAAGNTTINSQTNGAVVDLFGWVGASSTALTGNFTKYGISTSTTSSDYGTSASEALMADWADITALPQVTGGKWHTLSSSEWTYLLNTRTVTVNSESKPSYGEGIVNGANGLIILPDSWNGSACSGFTYGKSYYSNEFTESTTPRWSDMEDAGCVFLPNVGYREASGVVSVNVDGHYWSSTPKDGNQNLSNELHFHDNFIEVTQNWRTHGFSVRLVCDAE